MRIIIASFLMLHGLAHLVGFLGPWGLTPAPTAGAAPPSIMELFNGQITLGDGASRALSVLSRGGRRRASERPSTW